jgi:hypothetical protein
LDLGQGSRQTVTGQPAGNDPGGFTLFDGAHLGATEHHQAPKTGLIRITYGQDAVQPGAMVRFQHQAEAFGGTGGNNIH